MPTSPNQLRKVYEEKSTEELELIAANLDAAAAELRKAGKRTAASNAQLSADIARGITYRRTV